MKDDRRNRFESLALPHLDAAYNLARWLSGSASDADDVVQDAFLRAFRFFDTFDGDNARAWLLAIVRNTWFSEWRRRHPSHQTESVPFDDETTPEDALPGWDAASPDNPETLIVRRDEIRLVHRALSALPPEYREVVVLRELEDMSYRDIATVAGVPVGTVMSRLSRGRRLLGKAVRTLQEESTDNTGVRLVRPSDDPDEEKSNHG